MDEDCQKDWVLPWKWLAVNWTDSFIWPPKRRDTRLHELAVARNGWHHWKWKRKRRVTKRKLWCWLVNTYNVIFSPGTKSVGAEVRLEAFHPSWSFLHSVPWRSQYGSEHHEDVVDEGPFETFRRESLRDTDAISWNQHPEPITVNLGLIARGRGFLNLSIGDTIVIFVFACHLLHP